MVWASLIVTMVPFPCTLSLPSQPQDTTQTCEKDTKDSYVPLQYLPQGLQNSPCEAPYACYSEQIQCLQQQKVSETQCFAAPDKGSDRNWDEAPSSSGNIDLQALRRTEKFWRQNKLLTCRYYLTVHIYCLRREEGWWGRALWTTIKCGLCILNRLVKKGTMPRDMAVWKQLCRAKAYQPRSSCISKGGRRFYGLFEHFCCFCGIGRDCWTCLVGSA